MTHLEYAKTLRNGLVHTPDSLQAAYQFANDVALGTDNPAAVLTAVHMILNAVAQDITELSAAEAETA